MLKLKELSDENQTECHEIEPSPWNDKRMPEIILRVEMNF
jgi:hypothetical protein